MALDGIDTGFDLTYLPHDGLERLADGHNEGADNVGEFFDFVEVLIVVVGRQICFVGKPIGSVGALVFVVGV